MTGSILVHVSTPLESRANHLRSGAREWRPRCTCGWLGNWWTTQGKAIAESVRHEEE